MSPSGSDPRLRDLARQLGLPARGDCVKRLREYALSRVREPVQALEVRSARTLLDVVAGLVSAKVLFIRDDGDIPRFAREHGTGWPELGGQLKNDFLNRDTMGLVLAHPAPRTGAHRYFAFIDARAARAVQAYFTAWHEIAHLLLHPTQLSFSGFRRVTLDLLTPKDPVEAVVDQVAGELAFFEPLVRPELEDEMRRIGRLTIDGIGRIRGAVTPEASFWSCAQALVRMLQDPAVFLVADMTLKPTQARAMSSSQLTLIAGVRPEEKLRVVSAFPNTAAAQAGFKIFRHMRVPPDSVIAVAYHDDSGEARSAIEDQKGWESGGYNLDPLGLRVEAKKFGSVVYALMHCSPPVRS